MTGTTSAILKLYRKKKEFTDIIDLDLTQIGAKKKIQQNLTL